jgi:hypothetical protein
MQPISFGKHCERCHELVLDGRLEGVHVPHGSPDRALDVIWTELLHAYVGMDTMSSEADASSAGGGEAGVRSLPSHEEMASEALDLEQALYSGKSGCEKCHDVTERPQEPGKSRYVVVEPKVKEQWMPASKFTHGAHATTPCRECHDAAERSTSAGDILVPGVARCRDCHGDPGVQGKIESPCLECHRYHAAK